MELYPELKSLQDSGCKPNRTRTESNFPIISTLTTTSEFDLVLIQLGLQPELWEESSF